MQPTSASRSPIYLMADLGNRHGGDFDLAVRMVSAAARAGVDAVVLDLYQTERISKPGKDDQYRRLKVAELRPSQFRCLYELSHELGIDFIVHPRDPDSLEQSRNLADGLWISFAGEEMLLASEWVVDDDIPIFIAGRHAIRPSLREAVARLHERRGGSADHSVTLLTLCARDSQPLGVDEARDSLFRIRSELRCAAGISDRTKSDAAGQMAAAAGADVICRRVAVTSSSLSEQRATLVRLERWVQEVRQAQQHSDVTGLPFAPTAPGGESLRRVA